MQPGRIAVQTFSQPVQRCAHPDQLGRPSTPTRAFATHERTGAEQLRQCRSGAGAQGHCHQHGQPELCRQRLTVFERDAQGIITTFLGFSFLGFFYLFVSWTGSLAHHLCVKRQQFWPGDMSDCRYMCGKELLDNLKLEWYSHILV